MSDPKCPILNQESRQEEPIKSFRKDIVNNEMKTMTGISVLFAKYPDTWTWSVEYKENLKIFQSNIELETLHDAMTVSYTHLTLPTICSV